MLSQHFVAAIAASTKANTGLTKDAAIFVHEWQPLAGQQQAVFKKSAAAPNGIAVTNSHIFAAQADKAVVHVYSRLKATQEAVVPFPERIHSIAVAARDTVLLLGTESGRILAWEICSGRLVSTPPAHLQPVTALAVDASSRFFLSGSSDAMVHVWALPALLAFSPDAPPAPVRSLAAHRAPISSLACGHSASSANIAVSVAADRSAIVWDYHAGHALRTYLLPDAPTAVVLDPADRALYVAYADASLHALDFYDDAQQTSPRDVLRDPSSAHRPVQPSPKTRFGADSQKLGAALSLALSWDGTTLLSGHTTGKVASWDLAKANYLSTLATLPGPVSNLQFLPPTGFANPPEPSFHIQTVVKPKHEPGLVTTRAGLVPPNYTLNMQFTTRQYTPHLSATEAQSAKKTAFDEALAHPIFPTAMLDESLAELESWSAPSKGSLALAAHVAAPPQEEDGDAPDPSNNNNNNDDDDAQQAEVNDLKKQLVSLQRIQKTTFEQLAQLRDEKEYFVGREKKRAERAKAHARKKQSFTNGGAPDYADGHVDMNDKDESSSSESESDHDGAATR